MKKYLLLLTVILLTTTSMHLQAQEEDGTRTFLNSICNNYKTAQYDSLYEYMTPACKNLIPKNLMIAQFGNVDNNPNYDNKILGITVKDMSRTYEHEGFVYTKADFTIERRIKYKSKAPKDLIEALNTYLERTNKPHFVYDEKKRTVNTTQTNMVIICAEKNAEGKTVYSFMPYSPSLLPYMSSMMPQEVVNNLLKY